MTKSKFTPLFKTEKVVNHCKKVFAEKKKPWDERMVAQAMVIQIDANQSTALVNAFHKLKSSTQTAHALRVLEAYQAGVK